MAKFLCIGSSGICYHHHHHHHQHHHNHHGKSSGLFSAASVVVLSSDCCSWKRGLKGSLLTARARRASSSTRTSNKSQSRIRDPPGKLESQVSADEGEGGSGGDEFNDKQEAEVEAILRELPGLERDFWEGPQWNAFGFFVQYLWAFGIGFAVIACGVAVATYNEGASDFKQTPAYKESLQSRDFPGDNNDDTTTDTTTTSPSQVFETNPTEDAPAIE